MDPRGTGGVQYGDQLVSSLTGLIAVRVSRRITESVSEGIRCQNGKPLRQGLSERRSEQAFAAAVGTVQKQQGLAVAGAHEMQAIARTGGVSVLRAKPRHPARSLRAL